MYIMIGMYIGTVHTYLNITLISYPNLFQVSIFIMYLYQSMYSRCLKLLFYYNIDIVLHVTRLDRERKNNYISFVMHSYNNTD